MKKSSAPLVSALDHQPDGDKTKRLFAVVATKASSNIQIRLSRETSKFGPQLSSCPAGLTRVGWDAVDARHSWKLRILGADRSIPHGLIVVIKS